MTSAMGNYIDLETAAQRSGKSVGHLRRQCGDKWMGAGLARLEQPAGGGKSTWLVSEQADPQFSRVRQADQINVDLRQYTAAQRDQAWSREKILRQWDDFCKTCFKVGFDRVRATNTFVERLLINDRVQVSTRTLYNWHKAYRARGIEGLIDGRTVKDSGKDAASPAVDPFLAEVQRCYLSPRCPKLTIAIELALAAAHEQGWQTRNYKACQRHIAKLPAQLIYKMRGGEDVYVAKGETWIEKDYTSIDSNDRWCADHHQFDVIVNCNGKLQRPWLSVFQDLRSRKIMGWTIVAHDPNTDVILSAFRSAVKAHGVPHALYIDNGKDYDSYALNGRTKKDRFAKRSVRVELEPDRVAGLFPQLGVKVNHVWPYHGQSKPIERWFGTLEMQTVVWPTYCGRSTQHKPEDLQLQLDRGKAPDLATFTQWFSDWLTAHEASHKHHGNGMEGQTPDAVYAACFNKSKRTASDDLLDLMCLRRVGPLKIGRNGVTWQGIRYGQYDLARYFGQDVVLRIDERDISTVQVYTVDDKLICIATSNEKLAWGADAQHLREAIASKKQDRKVLKDYVDRRSRMADDLPDRLVRAAAERARLAQSENPTPPIPPSLQPIRSPLEAALPAIQRAVEVEQQRQAVGSESTPLPTRFVYQPKEVVQEQSTSIGMSFTQLMAGRDALNEEAP